ncbi:MAG: ABC transporter permease [Treponema sp.]|jgi:ribose/xylose/arabinose/galactoside ABC-type transport system permease subunit|nr:ABC transporter permease [Treponema sp.]
MGAKISSGNRLSKQNYLTLWMLGLLVVLIVVVSILQPAFLSPGNLRNVINQNVALIIISMAVTMLMTTGNFDVSVGGIIGMGGVLCAWFSQSTVQGGAGLPYGIAIVLALTAAAGLGLLNGLLVERVGVASIIVTLGTMSIARGIAYIGASGSMVTTGLPKVFRVFGVTEIAGFFSLPMIFMIIIVLAFLFVEARTVFGQRVYFIGANRNAAKLSGIKVGRQIITLFVISGFLSGFAGIILASKLGGGESKVGLSYEFDAVVATILGGTSVTGGSGTVIGTVIGVFIIGILSNALNLFGVGTDWQSIVKGLVIVAAILFQRFAAGRRASRAA